MKVTREKATKTLRGVSEPSEVLTYTENKMNMVRDVEETEYVIIIERIMKYLRMRHISFLQMKKKIEIGRI